MAQSTDVLVDKPNGIKPYRDYLDPLHKLSYDQERNLQCATVNYTHDKILKDINVKGEVHVASYKDLIKRHLRQEETIILIRNIVDLEIRNKILETHISEGESGSINCEQIIEHAKVNIKQTAIETIGKNANKFKSQEPSDLSTKNSITDDVIADAYHLVAQNLLAKLQNNMQSLEYRKDDEGNAARKVILQCGNPFLLTVTEVVTASVRTGTGAGDREEAHDFVRYAMSTEQTKVNEVAKTDATIKNVISQVAALTCAVAEKFQESDDKKLRIRNLDSVITAPTDYSGTKEAKAEARKKREDQLKNWLDNLTGKDNFKPAYSFYLIDPKKNDSRQKVTAILTVSLEQDKYRIEQLISKDRGGSRDKPSSQRYTGQDPAAFNIPKFSDISSKIKCLYVTELDRQLKSKEEDKVITKEKRTELKIKWDLDPDNNLFISRRTSRNPFRIFFEFTDPTSNLTLMRYNPGTHPFEHFDFSQAIPNPATRDKAKMDENYTKRYKTYKK